MNNRHINNLLSQKSGSKQWFWTKWKYLTNKKMIYGANEAAELEDPRLPRYIRITDLNEYGELKAETFKSLPREKAKPYLLKKGDLLLARSGATVGKSYIHKDNSEACFAGYLIKYSPDEKKVLPKLVYYFTQSSYYKDWVVENTIQATIQNVNAEKYRNLMMPVPPMKYQYILVKFLDEKTTEIDNLIADKEKLIKLLGEKRQSIITETVTKGLNPNVKMKDSGMEWLGEIPEHWKTSKVKYTTYVKGRIGWQGLRFEEFVDEGPYLITGMHFKNDSVNWEACYHISQERYEEAPEIQIKEGDLLLTKDGTIGKLAYINYLPGKASLNSHLLVMRPSKNLYKNKFMYWYMKSISFINFININQSGTTFAGISQQSIENLSFPLPGLEEQEKIVDHLDNEISMVNKSIEMVSEQINKLKEYRQSLIYEAVTGKIDVQEMMNEAGQEEVPSS